MSSFDVLVISTTVGLANDFIDITEAKRMSAAGVKAYVFISILRLHLWWCPLHNCSHRLPFWKNGGKDPFHELYFWDHVLRYHLHEGEGQSDWDFDPFTRESIRKTLPGNWLRSVKITRGENSVTAYNCGRSWERKAWNIYEPLNPP